MTLQLKEQIAALALQGYGYQKISNIIGLSPNTVKSHLRRHPVIPPENTCWHCGASLVQLPHRKTKKFCNDKCRMAYWKAHDSQIKKKAYYALVCQTCGKEFQSYGKKDRKYCCRACYAEARRKCYPYLNHTFLHFQE